MEHVLLGRTHVEFRHVTNGCLKMDKANGNGVAHSCTLRHVMRRNWQPRISIFERDMGYIRKSQQWSLGKGWDDACMTWDEVYPSITGGTGCGTVHR